MLAFGLVWLARVDLLIVLAAAAFANVASRRLIRAPAALVSVAPLVALTPAGWLDFREAIAGISAAVVAIILSVTIALAPAAVTDPIAALIALASFAAVALAKRDVALVAATAMLLGVGSAFARAM